MKYLRYGLCALIILFAAVISIIAVSCESSDTGVTSSPLIDLQLVLRGMSPGMHMYGPLADDAEFFSLLGETILQEIVKAQEISHVQLSTQAIGRSRILSVPADKRIVCATRSGNTVCFVEDLYPGRLLKRFNLTTEVTDPLLEHNEETDDPAAREIHSLSISPSGKFLAFLIPYDNRYANWDDQSLMVCDLETLRIERIWKGDVSGPRGILDPYRWVQPLPWTPEEDAVFVAVAGNRIVSIGLEKKSETVETEGYLPIGVVSRNRLLFLERKSHWFRQDEWLLAARDRNTKQRRPIGRIVGVREIRAPLLSPDERFACFIVRAYPEDRPVKGIHIYTLFVRLDDFSYALVRGEITAWCNRADDIPASP